MIDLVEREKELRASQTAMARLGRHFKAWPIAIAAAMVAYVVYVAGGMQATAPVDGVITGLRIARAVTIYRDARGIPYIRAAGERDAFFAQGFVQGSDRLFQMDLIRRYAYGELAEMLGPIQLASDEELRVYDVRDIVANQWRHLPPQDREDLTAFSNGVNAAMQSQPLPLEFRLLLYRPRAWTPRDSLAAAMALTISVDDTAENVLRRDALWRSMTPRQFAQTLPLSDSAYDVAADGTRYRTGQPSRSVSWLRAAVPSPPLAGSNAWAAGALRERSSRALLANDPHLSLSIPGIWYALEVRAPGLHAAGVTIPGLPGIVLGHNDRIAWAATNAMVSTVSLFEGHAPSRSRWKREIFHVRFSADTVKFYYRTRAEFAVGDAAGRITLERWPPYVDSRSAVSTIFALDRSRNIAQAVTALAAYAGPPQNFIIAAADGRVAYHLAGVVPNDPAWGRFVHPASDLKLSYAPIPFDRLPHVNASRKAVLLSANNKMYAPRYPYRLSPMFAPPYRAYRIAQLLAARHVYDVDYFQRMQLDVRSPVDAQFAHRLAAYASAHRGFLSRQQIGELASWDGSFSPGSNAASLERDLRSAIERSAISPYAPFDALRGTAVPANVAYDMQSASETNRPWRRAGEVAVLHPFGPIGFPFLNAAPFPGDGDRYTIRVQTPDITQSFRAVWVAGDWDRGGLSLPAGESGEFGSRHYDDLRNAWVVGALAPLPFSDAAVRRTARECLTLER